MNEPPTTSNESRDSNHEPRTTNHDPDDEISLLDLLIVLAKHKKLILGFPFVVAVLAAGYSLLLPNIYTGTAVIMAPQQQSQSASAVILAQLGSGLGALAGGAAAIKGPNDLYVGMLRSRTVADDLIQRFDLNKLWEQKYQSNTRKQLESITKIDAGKDGLITIEVSDKDPKRAADLANAFVDGLRKLTQVLAVTEASRRRLFYERELARAKHNLDQAQVAARQALQHGGLVNVDAQGLSMAQTTARLSAEIAVKEVQIGAMRTFAADRNPDLLLAQQELESMKHQLAKIEDAGGPKSAIRDAAGQGIESMRLLRDVKYNEVMVNLLSQQYGMAKIDEAMDPTVVQVMDKAIVPDRKSKPNRKQIVLLSALVAGFVAVFWAFVSEAITKAATDPERAARLQAVKRNLAWR